MSKSPAKRKITVRSDGRFSAWIDGYLVRCASFDILCQMVKENSFVVRKKNIPLIGKRT